MSTTTAFAGSIYNSVAPATPVELFPSSVEEVFDRLNRIRDCAELYEPGDARPSAETVAWAKRVLLRIVPRRYVIGAEIDAFNGEIHVSWEKGNRRVVVFLPEPNVLKLYLERIKEDGEVEHFLRSSNDPWAINAFLGWLYS